MLYFADIEHFYQQEIWAGKYFCPICKCQTDFHLERYIMRGYIFFVPFMSITKKRIQLCDRCGHTIELRKAEYKAKHKSQWSDFLAKKFPAYIVINDYHPKALKMWQKYLAVALTGLWAYFAISGSISMVSTIDGMDISVPIGLAFFLVLGIVPLVFALLSMRKALIKNRLYKAVITPTSQ